jgi:hypothetical protein
VIDVWTKETPTNKTLAFKIEGDRKSGFVFSAKIEGQGYMEITGFLESLRANKWKSCLLNYVAGR